MRRSEWHELRASGWVTLVEFSPTRLYTAIVSRVANTTVPPSLRPYLWNWLADRIGIDRDEAERPLDEYENFSDLFTRALRSGAREIDGAPDAVVAPVDGCISAIGMIESGKIIQAKGIDYTIAKLLADPDRADHFQRGTFATLYLRPRDYHRVHLPFDATLSKIRHIPGRLLPVQPAFVRRVSGLYVSNERMIFDFNSDYGMFSVVCVGATAVGAISNPFMTGVNKSCSFAAPVPLSKGQEIATFNLGSTVIVLFETEKIRWRDWHVDDEIRVGQALGHWR